MMKKLLAAAVVAATLAPGASTPAEAQSLNFTIRAPAAPVVVYRPGYHTYAPARHSECQRKSWRLSWFDRNARSDGYYSRWERTERRQLVNDLDRSCGRWRWRD
jgi:hypothetical protein